MTDTVHVPRKLMKHMLRKGWGLVGNYPTKNDLAVLMHPPGWTPPVQIEEKKENDG